VIVLLAALLLFAETFSFGFMSDDFYLVHRVRNEGFFFGWGGENGDAFFRPLTALSYLTDNLLWGLNPSGYHLTNVLWHLICTVLVFLLTKNILKRTDAALSAGFVFLLLACHSESVSWVSGRTDLIATAFCLGSILLFLRGSWWAVPLFAAGLMAKESVAITPLLWGLFYSQNRNRGNGLLIAFGFAVPVIYATARFLFSESFPSWGGDFSFPGLIENSVRYMFRVFIPSLPHVLRPFVLHFPAAVLLFVAVIASALWFFIRRSGRKKEENLFLILAGCFFVSLLPVILMKVSLFDSQSERFLYLPGVFAVIALCQWAYSVFSRRTAFITLLAFSVLQGAFLYRSNRNWKTAGEMCSSIALEISQSGPGSVEIPDNYNGAYVFRNGLSESILMLR
jgi:hypothetical protein